MNTIELKKYREFQSYIWNMEDISNQPEKYVYKIMPFKHFMTLIKEKELFFRNVKAWDDPYELILFKQEYYEKGEKLDLSDVEARFFGQSWSYLRDSDAMWRIYSSMNSLDTMGVRIKTSVQKIYNLLYADGLNKEFIPNIGNVLYLPKKDVMDWIKNNAHNDIISRTVESLFIKRNNFSHESEFRIILQTPSVDEKNQIAPCQDGMKIPIDVDDFIYEVAFDPRIDDETFNYLRFITQKYMAPNKRIMRSTLYKINQPIKIKFN